MPKIMTGGTARRLSLSEGRVRQLEAEGKLRAERTLSGVRLFDVDEVDALAAQRAKQAERRSR